MADVIEACADGGFDIPATPVVVPASRTKTRSSMEPTEPKPRRIRIQLEDDDDDDGDDNGNNNEGGRISGALPAPAPADAATGANDEKIGDTPASNRPRYTVYKIEAHGEDPVLEVVVSLSGESKAAPISTAKATTAHARDAHASDAPQAPACPCVSISSDGRTVAVDPGRAAEGGEVAKADVGGRRRRFSLKLPHRVVPGTATSFFSNGDVTVRAVLAEGE